MTGLAPPTAVALQDLRLEAAYAVLGPQASAALRDLHSNGTAYLQAVIDGLCDLSLRDPLTGVTNRRQLEPVLQGELDRVARSGDTTLLLMVDIDHFKQVNDRYGHTVGDQVLRHVAQRLTQCIRPMDTLVRYGGEEFAIVLPACRPIYGLSVADRMRQSIANSPVLTPQGEELSITISVGGAYALQWIRTTAKLWIQRADQQLYRAKHAGRNRVHIESQPESMVSAEEKSCLFEHLAALGDPGADDDSDDFPPLATAQPAAQPGHPLSDLSTPDR